MAERLATWVWTGAAALACVAGMVNVVGYLGFEHQAITRPLYVGGIPTQVPPPAPVEAPTLEDADDAQVLPGLLADDFLAVAERSGLMRELDAWVLEQAVELVGMWTSSGLWPEGWSLSVNQSATAVSHRSYATLLGQALGAHKVPPAALEIEIREGALVKLLLKVGTIDRNALLFHLRKCHAGWHFNVSVDAKRAFALKLR